MGKILASPLLSTVAWLALAAYLFFVFDGPYLSYPTQPVPVLTKVVTPGSNVLVSIRRCNTRSKTQIYPMVREMVRVDGSSEQRGMRVLMAASTVTIKPGCATTISPPGEVPRETPPGRWYIDAYGQVEGYVRTHQVVWQSEEFEVVAVERDKPN